MRRGILLILVYFLIGGFFYWANLARGEEEIAGESEEGMVAGENEDEVLDENKQEIIEGENQISEEEEAQEEGEGVEETIEVQEGDLVINEFMANPNEGENEWIEIFNKTENNFDLESCEIEDATEKPNSLDGKNIESNKYLVLEKSSDFSFGLNNDGDTIILNCGEKEIDKVSYKKTEKGKSFSRIPNGEDSNDFEKDFQITEATKGEENKEEENHAPTAEAGLDQEVFAGAEIYFDGSDSNDEDGDNLTFSWDFGDGEKGEGIEVKHIYSAAGNYTVTLTVSDGKLETKDTLKIAVKEIVYSDKIIINEILADPEGDDSKGEFIELFNTGSEDIDLKNWILDDAEAGSRPYIIPEESIIKASGFAVFYRSETGIALNNTSDKARLIKPNGVLASEVFYEKSYSSASYNQIGGEWKWSKKITPGAQNEIEELEAEDEEEVGIEEDAKEMSILEVKKQDIGTFVEIEGVVSVLPGNFSEYYFYLAGSGIQVYFSKGDFPLLKLGDKISLKGFVSKFGGEARIRITDKDNIKILGHGEKISIHKIKTGEIGEKWEGSLVELSGEVIKKQGSNLYINDKSGEARVYIDPDAGIETEIKKGDFVVIIGIVSETSSGYRILPRMQEDIKIVKGTSTSAVAEKIEKTKPIKTTKLPATGGNIFEPIFAGFLLSLIKFRFKLFS